MKFKLSQIERVIVAFCYASVLIWLFEINGGNVMDLGANPNIDSNIWFYSGAFMIILGVYVVEPYFTKPANVIANASAVLIALFGLTHKQKFFAYDYILWFAITILILGVFAIGLKDAKTKIWQRIASTAYSCVDIFGASKFIFSVVYLSAAYSYFAEPGKLHAYLGVLTLWFCLVSFDVIGWAVNKLFGAVEGVRKIIGDEIGVAIGCENPFLYKVEADSKKLGVDKIAFGDLVAMETGTGTVSIGMVVEADQLVDKRWLSVHLFRDKNDEILKTEAKNLRLKFKKNSIYSKTNCAYLFDIEKLSNADLVSKIERNPLYQAREEFVGSVTEGSNINVINFAIVREINKAGQKITEGSILKTTIYGQETLYRVINGRTVKEPLEKNDRHGFTIGIARKLGTYRLASKDLDVSPWIPSAFSPLFFAFSGAVAEDRIKEIAQHSIGRLPNTDLEIPLKDINALVTHNTAILGILGIGKSCLTFEIIQKVIAETFAKVICFDITNEYFDELNNYGCNPAVLDSVTVNAMIQDHYKTINKDVSRGGNHPHFREQIAIALKAFFESQDERLLIINPEDFDVSKQTYEVKPKKIGPGKDDWEDQAPMAELTIVEKTRILTEEILWFLKEKGKSKDAECFLVFEEAHALIPEWGSVANKGDEGATNGIARVVLQGRKYGLGSLVVTQRTANISKSVLNQCNTIFALRVFDDTGKAFLSNYIGDNYADALATLEERHAIAIGKGLNLKQPVIVQLNDRANFLP